jgi:hypothetical protein
MPWRRKLSGSAITRVLLPVISVAVVLAASEAALRLAGYGYPAGRAHADLLRHESTLGWEKVPNETVVYPWRGRYIRETSNAQGFRGPEIPIEKGLDEFRLLLLGDSFCEGYLVSDDEVFSALLPRLWSTSHSRPLSIINAGVAGYSTDQELLLFERDGAKVSPDLTVLFFFDNDVWFNTTNTEYRSAKPLFVLENGVLKLTSVPVPAPARGASSPSGEPAGEAQPLAWLGEHSHLYRLVRDRVRTTPSLASWAIRLGWFEPPGMASPSASQSPAGVPREFLVYERRPTPQQEAAWNLTKTLLRELKREAEAAGSGFMVFYVPTSPAVYDDAWEATQALYGIRASEWDIRQPESELARVCADLGIAFRPTTERFRNEAARLGNEGQDLYFKDEGHWNAQGHRFAASLLGELLSEFLAARQASRDAR